MTNYFNVAHKLIPNKLNATSIKSPSQDSNMCVLLKAKLSSQKPRSPTNIRNEAEPKRKRTKLPSGYLSIKVMQTLLRRLLNEKMMPPEQLAAVLAITVKQLNRLLSTKPNRCLIPKINLPLIKLYCETKFNITNNQQ